MNATRHHGSFIGRELRLIRNVFMNPIDEPDKDGGEEFGVMLKERHALFGVKLSEFLQVYQITCDLLDDWHRAVRRGEVAFDKGQSKSLKELFGVWLKVSRLLKEKAEFFGRHQLPFESGALRTLRRYVEEATERLKSWKEPKLSITPALRTHKFSKKDGVKLKQLLLG